MTLGEKLSRLRRNNNYTQEQLASLLNVSRQAISKWESNLAYPETKQLIRLGELYNCSMDYLLKDEIESDEEMHFRKREDSKDAEQEYGGYETRVGNENGVNNDIPLDVGIRYGAFRIRERKSKRTVFGMPLWHIGKNARGFFAVGMRAKGVIAVGLTAMGIVSCGLVSAGLFSVGLLSVGLLALGNISVGLLAAGAISVGIVAAGGVCVGVLSVGAMSIGDFSVGAMAVGKYVAIGDRARGMIAIGETEAVGSLFEKTGELTRHDLDTIKEILDAHVPSYLNWAKGIVMYWLK